MNQSREFAGVAIVSNAAASQPLSGRWQYKLSNGSWTNLPSVSDAIPFILNSDSELRFLPTSNFSGSPGALSVRVLDNSVTYPEGPLAVDSALIAGGSGAASIDKLTLQTYVTRAANRAPDRVFFTTSKSIELDMDGFVKEYTVLGTFSAVDIDTKSEDLEYVILKAAPGSEAIVEKLGIEGNRLIVKTGATVSADELKSLSFSVTVREISDPTKILDSSTQYSTVTPSYFVINKLYIGAKPDSTQRTDIGVVPPAWAGLSLPIFSSATETSGDFSVQTGAYLSFDDILSDSLLDPYGYIPDKSNLESIIPLTPLLDFTLSDCTPEAVTRFEFELPDPTWKNIQKISYLKQLSNGDLTIFHYETDQYGVSTGARIETRDKNGNYKAVVKESDIGNEPIYLAVYIQDNGRGDDDINLGVIRDPGAPAMFNIREVAEKLTFETDPAKQDMSFSLTDTNGDGVSSVEFVVNREANYDNIVDFYRVDNALNGWVTIGTKTVKPGDADYIALALSDGNLLKSSTVLPSLATRNNTQSSKNLDFNATEGAGTWVPFVKVAFTGKTYVPYASANDDKFNHFGHAQDSDGYDYLYVEDLPGGGDKDHNDIIIRLKPSI